MISTNINVSEKKFMVETFNRVKHTSLIATIGFVLFLVAIVPALSSDYAEVRGTVTNVGVNQFTWDNSSFAGFYYDIDKNLGAETLTFRLTAPTATGVPFSDQPDANNMGGVVYETNAQLKAFKFRPWGQYDVIAFLGEPYFTSYDPTVTAAIVNAGENVAYLYDSSRNRDLMRGSRSARF